MDFYRRTKWCEGDTNITVGVLRNKVNDAEPLIREVDEGEETSEATEVALQSDGSITTRKVPSIFVKWSAK